MLCHLAELSFKWCFAFKKSYQIFRTEPDSDMVWRYVGVGGPGAVPTRGLKAVPAGEEAEGREVQTSRREDQSGAGCETWCSRRQGVNSSERVVCTGKSSGFDGIKWKCW